MINLLFDLDGCLIDSAEVQKAAFFGSYAAVVGDDNCPTFEEYMQYTGDSVDNVFRKMGLPAAMAPIYREISSRAVDKVKVFWDAIELIKEFRQYGCKVAICTGKDRYRANDILQYYHIDACFDAIIGAEDVKEPKPSPEPVLRALEALGIKKDTALMIGDGYNDILCARNAGVRSVLTLWFGDMGVKREADFVVSDIHELRKLLIQLM